MEDMFEVGESEKTENFEKVYVLWRRTSAKTEGGCLAKPIFCDVFWWWLSSFFMLFWSYHRACHSLHNQSSHFVSFFRATAEQQ